MMRINNRVVIDIVTLKVIERDFTEYTGPIAYCGGGSKSSSTSVDKKYNARMARIAEKQQKMSEQYFDFWNKHERPYEAAKLKANRRLLGLETRVARDELRTKRKELSTQRKAFGLQQEEMAQRSEEISMAKPVVEEYYKQALEGVDVGEETSRARADVAQSLHEAEGEIERHMSRLGVDPSSPAYAERMKTSGMEKAKAVGGAMSTARRYAEEENFQRVAGATAQFKGGLPR